MLPDLSEYNPLDYDNLTRNLVRELMSRGPYSLPIEAPFDGAGVYALFYNGDFKPYDRVRSPKSTSPIYVGKAMPPGGRKGAKTEGANQALYGRLGEHVSSIESSENISLTDFKCRFLVVTPLWITMAERFLLENFRPIWNVCIEGFGNHDPGSGRHQGEVSCWDALHPGRAWAKKLRQTRTQKDALRTLKTYLDENPPVGFTSI